MAQRRQERMARVVKEAVSDIVNNHLQDPRIEGFISITEVKIEPDLKKADVFLSIMGASVAKQ
ncbi:MAG: ribosome-binding factor A, partial [Phycisphaerae bacterium]